ncbi:MAG: prolipoprotein diacylglyceryl transferase [Parcubacteria group bacterium]|nr:prolipoprotein diacylglyceryl transferase [Parcubacteria group bacterium]
MLGFLHTFQPSPIAFSIGPFAVHWYGLLLALGVVAGYWLVGKLAKQQGITAEQAKTVLINALIGGFIGARLYHVVTDWGFYGVYPDQIIAVWNGGLAIHGAMLGALAVIVYYAKKRGLSFWKLADLFALPAILGQAIGRWGNYFNQELFGRPTDSALGIPITVLNRPAGYQQYEYFHPAFLYESLINFAIFAFLLAIFQKKRRPDGLVFWLYIGLYSAGRIIVESFRINEAAMVGSLRLPFLVSLVLAGASIAILLKALAAKHKPQ